MKFWDRLKERLSPGFDQQERVRIAHSGEKLEAFVASGSFDVLIDEVLDPMERESFEAFKKIDPTNSIEVLQTQKMAQIVGEIKRRVEKKIEAGLMARKLILENSTQEGEENG